MPRTGSVLSGLRAAQAASQSRAGSPHPAYLSPLLGQYAQWTMGRPNQNTALPRDPLTFLTGAFGPLSPIRPIGIDEPTGGDERPQPRRWQYPIAWNMPVGNPGSEGLKLADFQTLRLYSEIYSVARACIQLRKDEILGVGWDVGPTHDASKTMRDDREAKRDFGERRGELMRFFRKPDPNYNDFTTWLEAVLEEIFVVDALSIYLHPPRIRGKGVLGSNLAALDLIAGDTIRPLLDLRGGSPIPPNPAYQQYLYGVPRSDYMTMLAQDDVKDMGPAVREYHGDQLMYLPRNPRTWTPYGQAPLERCIVPVITGLRRQQWQMDFYLEGTIPGMFISFGDPEMTPAQIREWQDTLNALAGDQAWKHKMIGLPANSKVQPQKPPELADQSDEMIMSQVLMAYSVMPFELGILPKVAKTQSVFSGEQMARASQDVHERKTLKPDLLWLKNALFDRVIQGICGQHDMEWRWDGLEEDKDEMTLTSLLVDQIGAGLTSIDEARIEIGRDPWGLPITQDPGWATAAGFMPLGSINPDTGMPYLAQGPQPNGVPAIPGSPAGSSRSGRAVTGQPYQPAGQRPDSATGTPKEPTPGARPASPGHDAAAAAEMAVENKPRPVPKAALAELNALRRHVLKGRAAATWEARHLPQVLVEEISADIERGHPVAAVIEAAAEDLLLHLISGDEVVIKQFQLGDRVRVRGTPHMREHLGITGTIAQVNGNAIGIIFDGLESHGVHRWYATTELEPAGQLGKGGGSIPVTESEHFTTGQGSAESTRRVVRQLLRDYPDASLDWVREGTRWDGPFMVPLSMIDTSNRRTWNAWHEPDRIAKMSRKMKRLIQDGRHLTPAVLVDTPESDRQTRLIVIDGHHRTLAAMRAEMPIWAWIGTTNRSKGDWLTFHNSQLKDSEKPGEDQFAGEPHAA